VAVFHRQSETLRPSAAAQHERPRGPLSATRLVLELRFRGAGPGFGHEQHVRGFLLPLGRLGRLWPGPVGGRLAVRWPRDVPSAVFRFFRSRRLS
jgi:hypothetical protein